MTGDDWTMEVVSWMDPAAGGYCDVTIRENGLVAARHRASFDFPAAAE